MLPKRVYTWYIDSKHQHRFCYDFIEKWVPVYTASMTNFYVYSYQGCRKKKRWLYPFFQEERGGRGGGATYIHKRKLSSDRAPC